MTAVSSRWRRSRGATVLAVTFGSLLILATAVDAQTPPGSATELLTPEVWVELGQPTAGLTTPEPEVVVNGRATDGALVAVYVDADDDGAPDGPPVAQQQLSPEARGFEFHVELKDGENRFLVQAERDDVLSELLTTPLVTRVPPAPVSQPVFHPGLVELQLARSSDAPQTLVRLEQRLRQAGVEPRQIERFFPTSNDKTLQRWYLLETSPGQEQRARRAIAADRDVSIVEFVPLARPGFEPNDPRRPNQPFLDDIEAISAWDHGRSAPGTRIAVLDTQFEQGHIDLQKFDNVTMVEPAGCRNTFADWDHGTAVAGTAAADTNNGIGIAGVGFEARLLGFQLGIEVTDPNNGAQECHISGRWPQALQLAVNQGADIVNMSFTLFNAADAAGRDVIRNASNRGVLLVAIAGNEGQLRADDPGSLPEVMNVAALNGNARAGFSNWGPTLSIAAPGVNILTTVPNGHPCGQYCPFNGTSFSAPMVAGGGALVAEHWGTRGLRLRHRLEDAADDMPAYPGDFNNDVGNGELNLARAMTERVVRLAGVDRQRTAGEVSREAAPIAPPNQPQVVNTIVLISAEKPNGWVDTLASGPLLNRYGTVFVSTRNDRLDEIATQEINRLFATEAGNQALTIIIPGGTGGSISAAVENDLRNRFTVRRIAGANRYATAAAIAADVTQLTTTAAVVTRGDEFSDALAMAGVAARHGHPMLFVNTTDVVPRETCDFLRARPQITTLHLAGGTAAITPGAAAQLATGCGTVRTIRRQAGVNRIDTAVQIAQTHFPAPDGFVLAYGYDWPDAIAGAGLSRVYNSPVLLTDYGRLHPTTSSYIAGTKLLRPSINIAWVLGGPETTVSREAEADLEDLIASP